MLKLLSLSFLLILNFNITLLSQIYTNSTVDEMKLNMKTNYKGHYLLRDKGSKVFHGSDTLTLYEYWGVEKDSSSSVYMYYSNLGRIVSFSKTLNLNFMKIDVGNLDLVFDRHNPPMTGFLISWDITISQKTIIGIILDEKNNKYTLIEMKSN